MADMEMGQIVDYIEEYNRIHDTNHKDVKEPPTKRVANQSDWDWFLG